MDKNRAVRRSCNYNRTNGNRNKARENIAEFDRACMYVSILLGISFGLMFFVGLI